MSFCLLNTFLLRVLGIRITGDPPGVAELLREKELLQGLVTSLHLTVAFNTIVRNR